MLVYAGAQIVQELTLAAFANHRDLTVVAAQKGKLASSFAT